eukprot:TRINITY_DN2314_c3_g1_i1.p1 TRINITY_DN2314_c3_g1~~TRINITY_DN2314_c3_g1_i1.p1  ORF type:complete len:1094 (+),score=138.92 TRINITY_DN2314_c3_g1_i1:12288-15569(+)
MNSVYFLGQSGYSFTMWTTDVAKCKQIPAGMKTHGRAIQEIGDPLGHCIIIQYFINKRQDNILHTLYHNVQAESKQQLNIRQILNDIQIITITMQQQTPTKDEQEEGYTEIFAWGADRYGQLGLGNKQSGRCYCTPRFCSFNIVIKAVACGEEHSAFITGKGQIFTVGSNSEGRLGLGDRSMLQSSTPCLVEALSRLNAVHVSCGWGHTAAVMDNGDLYTWGVGEYGALGVADPESQWFPVKVAFPGKQRVNVVNATCGTRHTAIVDDKGKLYTCGAGDAGQLGTGSREKELLPRAVNAITEKVEQAACGVFHTVVLTKTGKVYTMGGNNFGQLGTGNKRSSTVPIRLKDLDPFIITKVSAGHHSAALTDKGELFIWGTGVFGEFLSPTRFGRSTTFLAPVKEISVGGSFGAAVDTEGNVYTWGSNTSGELGMGDFEPRTLPYPVKALQGKTVIKASCGGSYAIALGRTLTAQPPISSISRAKTPLGYKSSERRTEGSTGKQALGRHEDRTPPREFRITPSKAEEERKAGSIKDELLAAIKDEQQKRINLEKHIEDLELARTQLLKKEAAAGKGTVSASQIKERIMHVERQIDAEREKSHQILRDLENMQSLTGGGDSKKIALERRVNSLQRDIELLKDENMRLRGERIAQKSGENSRLSELLREYEDKIEREIEEKHRVLRDKQKEIANLHEVIPQLKATISEVEGDRIKLEEYYREEIKKLEEVLEDYKDKIGEEEGLKQELARIHDKNTEKAEDLRRTLARTTHKKEELEKEIENCKSDIEQLHLQALDKQKELEQELKKHDNLRGIIAEKESDLRLLREQCADKEAKWMEEINKLRREISDKVYDNEDVQNKINVKQIEIDTLNKDVVAWRQVANNVQTENEALQKIIEALEDKNRRLADSLDTQLQTRSKENQYRLIQAIKTSQSPMKIRKIIGGEQHLQYTPEPFSETPQNIPQSHGQLLRALEAYAPEEDVGDEGRPLERGEKISDPYLREREALQEFEGVSSPERRVEAPSSTNKLISDLGVDSPIRKRVAKEALSPTGLVPAEAEEVVKRQVTKIGNWQKFTLVTTRSKQGCYGGHSGKKDCHN